MFLDPIETPGGVWTPPLPKVKRRNKPARVEKIAPSPPPKVPVTFRQKFIAELRSGRWVQCRGTFYKHGAGYMEVCASYLLFHLSQQPVMCVSMTDLADCQRLCRLPLKEMNDGGGKSFAQIADYIEGLPY